MLYSFLVSVCLLEGISYIGFPGGHFFFFSTLFSCWKAADYTHQPSIFSQTVLVEIAFLQNYLLSLSVRARYIIDVQWFLKENQQSPIYVVNCHFHDVLTDAKSAATTGSSWLVFTIFETFPLRYSMTLYLNWYQRYNRSKLKTSKFTK